MASRSGDRVREREMTGAKSIPQLKVMLTAFFQNASRHSHLRLSVRQQFGLAIMPTVVVLLMVGCVQALINQPLIFTSLASSAFLVYLDPEHPTNRVRTFLIAQGSAALLGFGSVSLLGTGFLAPGVALVLTIVLTITLDAMFPPAIPTALSFAFHTSSLNTLAIFGLTMVIIASLVALQRLPFGWCRKEVPRLQCTNKFLSSGVSFQ
jgi:CBS-domain-containing membrane protein